VLLLKRQRRVALHDPLLDLRALAFFPERCAMDDTVEEWAAVVAGRPLDGPWDTDELAFPSVGGRAYRRVAVTSHIEKREMRC
jgi:hypothetical protein